MMHGVANPPSILERPVYGVSEAAGLLGLRPDRARAWLDGYERSGVRYPPVIREEPTGEDLVTWGEFVELGYLREYRRKGVPLQRLRPVIEELRREFETPYPLATAQPYVYGKELVLEVQVMRYDQQSESLGIQIFENRYDFRAGPGVEVAGRFVGEQHTGFHYDRTRNRDALALAARQLIRAVRHPLFQADAREHLGRAVVPRFRRLAREQHR
jgi:hypothetical protein